MRTSVVLVLVAAAFASGSEATRTGVNCRALKNPISMASKLCICEPCHVCAYSWSKLSCQLIVNSDTDVTDGSEVKPQQQTLDPAGWFLDEAGLTASRNGVQRPDLSVYSDGNMVSTYTAGDQLFAAVQKDVVATVANDSIYLTAWSVDEIPFDPYTDKTGSTSGFKALFGGAMGRGVDFRALVWQNLLEKDQNIKMRDYINSLPRVPNSPAPGRMIIDDRLPTLSSSHHQKTLVVRQKNELVAYVGGIDLTSDRWDTMYHNESVLRKEAKISRGVDGWVDAHLRIKGPATLDVGSNFLARWNSKTKPTQDLVDTLIQYKNPEYSPAPVLTANGPLVIPTTGTASVQIARTFSCKYKGYTEFAPKGERSILNARLKAIRQAKNYIYVEDQYFIQVPELVDALLEVLPRLQRLIVVVQRTPNDTKLAGYEKYMFDMVAPLQKRFPNKFQLFTPKASRNLYLHSKIMVIDDVFLSIGSANWNRRSMTSDSEMGANVVDRDITVTPEGLLVAKLARDFRVRKFIEYTGKSYSEMNALTFIDAANALDLAAKDPDALIEVLEVEEKASYAAVTEVLHQLADPNDSC